ncbi:LON peptidase substrate-binding domain-containing protein [Nitrospira sp. Ecomares 2.1]
MSSDFPSAESDTFPIPDIVPIFPLPTTVFFPETYLPLHIFEPRYREMVRQASAQGDCIGMALLKEGWEDEYEESPPIYPIGCVGRIISSHKLPDGRFNIVLQGLQRCTFEEQEVSTPYRQAQIIPYAQRGAASLDIETRINLEQVTQEYLTWKKAHELCQVIASGKLTDSILVHNLSAGLDLSPVEKQFLLESGHLVQQARRLIDLIRFKLADLRTAQG